MKLFVVKLIYLFLIFIFVCCSTPGTKTQIIETDRKVIEKTFDYAPEASDIDVRFEVSGNDLIGKLYRKEQTKFQVAKKEVKSFVYDKEGNLQTTGGSNYWGLISMSSIIFGCFYTLCINVPFNIYDYYSEKFSLGEKRKFEETEIKKNDFAEFNSSLFNKEEYSVLVNDEKKPLLENSSFKVPLDYFLKRADEGIEYKIYYKNHELKTGETWFIDVKISETSPKFKQLLAANQRAQRQREITKEREDKKQLAAQERERKRVEIREAKKLAEFEQKDLAEREVCTNMMAELSQYSNLIYKQNSYCHISCTISCQKGYQGSEYTNCINNCKTCWGILKYQNNDCNRGGFNPNNFKILRSNGF